MKRQILAILAAASLTAVSAADIQKAPSAGQKAGSTASAQSATRKPEKVKVKLTLAELKKMALEGNPTLAVYQERVSAAMAGITAARAAYYPTVSLQGTAQRARDKTSRTLGPYTSHMNYDLTLNATWTLFDGFQRRFALLAARLNKENAEQTEQDVRRQMLHAVSSAFYSALNSQDNMNIAREDAEYNNILLDDARKRYETGVVKLSEVLNFILQVRNAEVNFVTAEQNWRNAMVALAALVAIDLRSLPDSVWDHYELVATEDVNETIASFDTLMAIAQENRPDLKAAEIQIENNRANLKSAWGTYSPTITAFANYGFNRDETYRFSSSYDRVIAGGFQFNWTLFNGFRSPAQIAQNRANLNAAIMQRKQILTDIESDLRQNIQELETSRKQFVFQSEILKTAKEIRDLVHQEYLGGSTTITRLNEAQTAVTKAAAERSSAYTRVLFNLETIKATTAQNLQ